MKSRFLIALAVLITLASCSSTTLVVSSPGKNAPPGQVKKATGSQSAKSYAPGTQKKKN